MRKAMWLAAVALLVGCIDILESLIPELPSKEGIEILFAEPSEAELVVGGVDTSIILYCAPRGDTVMVEVESSNSGVITLSTPIGGDTVDVDRYCRPGKRGGYTVTFIYGVSADTTSIRYLISSTSNASSDSIKLKARVR